MNSNNKQSSGVSEFVSRRHQDNQNNRVTDCHVDQDAEALVDMADGRDTKPVTSQQHAVTRSDEQSPLRNSESFSASQRVLQHQESNTYFGMVISMIRGLILPPQEIQHALRERDEASVAKLEEVNQELYHAYKIYHGKAKDLEMLLHNSVSREQLEVNRNAIIETYEQRLAEQAVQNSVDIEKVQQGAEEQVVAAKREVRAAQEKKDLATKSCRDYEHQIEKLQATIRNLQTVQLRSVESTQWAAQPTSEIEHRLKVLHSGIRQWAEDNTEDASVDSVLAREPFKMTVRGLLRRGCIRSGNQLRDCILRNKAMRKPGKASQVLLTAAVSFDILCKIIGNPFFAFVGDDEDDILRQSLGDGLEVLLDLIRTGDETGAETLRCQVLRLLDRRDEPGCSSSGAEIKDTVRESRDRALDQVVDGIMSEFMGELSAEQLAHTRDGLESLVQDAGALSWALWTRKARIEVQDWTSLKNYETDQMSFKATSGIFEAHPLHKRDLEDTPTALDGQSIALLCTPPIFVAGDGEGENYKKKTVLKKAIVWMG